MILLVTNLLRNLFSTLLNNLYWLYRLSKSNLGKNVKISFPIILRGKGNCTAGANTILVKGAQFAIAGEASLYLGKNTFIDSKASILINNEGSLNVGDFFKLGFGSRLYINSHWHFSDNVQIAPNCSFFARESGTSGKLIIGHGSQIGDNTLIDVCDNVIIGNEVAIGPNCILYTHDHDYNSTELAAWKGDLKFGEIIIEDGAWIGSGVTILPGVIIGKRAVIAAGAVITKSIPAFSVCGGVPAKSIINNYYAK